MLLEPKGGEDYLGQGRRAALREKDRSVSHIHAFRTQQLLKDQEALLCFLLPLSETRAAMPLAMSQRAYVKQVSLICLHA